MTAYPVRFSIVIPCYNRARSIGRTLESILQQSYPNWECIVVDDGSDDATELEAVVASMDDSRIRYVWRDNGGGGAARNTGIDEASGDYIAFLDSDDLFVREKLEVFSEAVAPDRPDLAFYAPTYVDRGVERMWVRPDRAIGQEEDMGEYLFVANQFIQTSTIVIHRDTARRVRFDPTLRKGQDLDFCVRLHHSGVRFRMLEQPLSVWLDMTEANRTSRVQGYEAPLDWLTRSKPLLTPKAVKGYRATVLAYYMAGQKPFSVVRDLIVGLIAGVPPKVVARQALRCFLPKGAYRRLVNRVVAATGRPATSGPDQRDFRRAR